MDRAEIEAAAARIAPLTWRTPLLRVPGPVLGVACTELWLKLEYLQRSGSFKARGMFNRMLAAPVPAAGAVVASGGNAGIAAADAVTSLGLHCEVFVPESCSPAKRAALAARGAVVTVRGAAYADALEACLARQRETGALLLHAYDQPEMVAGAGTLAREIEHDAGVPDRVLVSVGGGGLVAGIAAWFAGRTRIEAVEPEGAPTLNAALEAGRPVDVAVAGIAADALGARRLGAIAWELCRRWPVSSHLVSDDAIRAAQKTLWQALRIAIEPAAALPLALLQTKALRPQGDERLALVLCGANVDPGTVA